MRKQIEHIKAFIKKHKTLFIVLAVIKLLIKIGIVLFMISKANSAKAQSANQLLREGNKLYNKEKYNNATESYAKALQIAPKDVRAYFNQGDAFYKLNELENAKDLFVAVAKASANTDIQARALYNIGNIFYKQKKYVESARSYKESLKLNPKDEDAKYNLMMAIAKIGKDKPDDAPSEYAKKLKAKADELINQNKFKEAYVLMANGSKTDKTIVKYYAEFIKQTKDIVDILE